MNMKREPTTAMLAALAVMGFAASGLAESGHIELHPKGRRLTSTLQGPYASLPDGTVLAVE